MSTEDIVHNYISTLKRAIKGKHKCSYLDAVIINSKICNILLKLPIESSNNFDTIKYYDGEDILHIDVLHDLFESYVRMDVYKLTGVNYSEYKNMTIVERNLLLEYLGLKVDITNMDTAIVSDNEKQYNDSNNSIYNY